MPPKGKRAGRPIKKFPDISTRIPPSDNPSADLNILANAAQSVDFNFEQAWPELDRASERLQHVRTLQTDRGLSKDNRKQLNNAINSFHVLLVTPSTILNNTPDLYKDEFKNRAIALTSEYIQFCLDVVPKKDDLDKDQYLEMLLDKLIKPIRGQPSFWGHHSLQITGQVTRWEELRKMVPRATSATSSQDNRGPPPLPNFPPYSSEYNQQYPHYTHFQNAPPHHGYTPHPYYPPNHVVPQGYQFAPSNGPPHAPYYTPPNVFDAHQTQPAMHAAQHLNGPSGQNGYQPPRVYPQPTPTQTQMPSPIHLQGPTAMTSINPTQDERTPQVESHQDIDTHMETSYDPPDSPPPLRRPQPIKLASQSRVDRPTRVEQRRQVEDPVNPMANIRRHPSYSQEMRKVHGDIPAIIKLEQENYDDDIHLKVSHTPPKRPISVGSNEDLTLKRKRTDKGIQHIQRNNGKNTVEQDIMERSPSREEMRYQAVARKHEEDVQFLEGKAMDEVHGIATTPILIEDDIPFPRRAPMRRSMSQADIAVVDDLTPAIRELMSPSPREGSPDRDRWRAKSPILTGGQEIIPRRHIIPSHIRPINAIGNQSPLIVLPPGGNALGARSPEIFGEAPPRPRLEHSPPAELFDIKPTVHRQLFPIPTNATDMPALMTAHERLNSARHVEARDFYIHKRAVAIAKGSEWCKPYKDGTIRLGRYFALTQEEVDETKEYLRYITGHVSLRPKSMIRLTCRPRNGGPVGQNNHGWPENTMVFLNGKCLLTSMHAPLYIAPEELGTINSIRVKVHPNTVQGYFAVYLEVFSLLSFKEMKTFFAINSPGTDKALTILKELHKQQKEDSYKTKISLLCGGSDHIMTFPVYGKKCTHIERLDLSCFVEKVSVGPEFEWVCPFCGELCTDDIPVVVDNMILGILNSHKPNSKKEFFQITSDDQICDDSASDTETETDDDEEFTDETS